MVALEKGKRAPGFSLPSDDGKTTFTLEGLLDRKGALLAFFKTECPTCQLEFPFVERMAQALAGTGVFLLGIGQNTGKEIGAFRRTYGLRFPIATDLAPYRASAAYGLVSVPSLFLLDARGRILRTEVGFSKEGLEAILTQACALGGAKAPGLFQVSDAVPDAQPG